MAERCSDKACAAADAGDHGARNGSSEPVKESPLSSSSPALDAGRLNTQERSLLVLRSASRLSIVSDGARPLAELVREDVAATLRNQYPNEPPLSAADEAEIYKMVALLPDMYIIKAKASAARSSNNVTGLAACSASLAMMAAVAAGAAYIAFRTVRAVRAARREAA